MTALKRGPNRGPHRCKRTILQLKKPKNDVIINYDYFYLAHFSKFIQEGVYHIFSDNLHFGLIFVLIALSSYILINLINIWKKRVE
ncbi:MAG: hypothetical protein ACOC44_06895 [Promethearchaeia archaeon]